jgi:enamine deaminase RidA (YjgF/YER057c/UK114 family)
MGEGRQSVSSGSPFEGLIGFSRAIRVGDVIAVSGTAPIGPDGNTVGPGNAYAQSKRCLEIIQNALHNLGADLSDVIRTRVYMVDIDDLEGIAESHSEAFGETMPASTFILVKGFLDPEWKVEIEADAIVEDR